MTEDCPGCPECSEPLLETIAEILSVQACADNSTADIELVCLGDTRYIGLRATALEDTASACSYIINSGGWNAVGILLHGSAARQLAAALLDAADLLEGRIFTATQADFDALLTPEDPA